MKEKPNEMSANPLVKMIEVSEKRIVVRNCKLPNKNFSYIFYNFFFAFLDSFLLIKKLYKRNESNFWSSMYKNSLRNKS